MKMKHDNLPFSVRNWYLILILGIALIFTGTWVFNTPLVSYAALATLFAFTFLLTGILEIIFAISNRKEMDSWGWSLVGGIIDFLLGILLISLPETSMLFLSFYVGFGVLFRSAFAIARAIDFKKLNIGSWGILLVLGIIGLIFSFVLIFNPVIAGLTIVLYTGMAFIVIGFFHILFSFQLRKVKKWLKS